MPAAAKPEIDWPSIVLAGSLNPSIFHPAWFGKQGLIRDEEAKAELEIVSPQVAKFKLDWVEVQVTPERFTATAFDAGHALPLRDLVIGTFERLEHTPIRAVGLNRICHFKIGTKDEWHRLGDILAPKTLWSDVLAERPGLLSLTIEGKRPGSDAKFFHTRIEPSRKIEYGLLVYTNEHFDLTTSINDNSSGDQLLLGTQSVIDLIRGNWEQALEFNLTIASKLLAAIGKAD